MPTRCFQALLLAAALAVAGGARADALDRIKAAGELRWGADPKGGAPYVFPDPAEPNHLIGFEVELADAIAGKLGVRARLVQGQWEELLPLLTRGDFDVALNGIERTDEKRRVCLMSAPYYAAPELLVVRLGDAAAPRSWEALRGRAVGTLPNSLAERILLRAGAVPSTYPGGQDDIFHDLVLGRTDAALVDLPIVRYYAEDDPRLEVVAQPFGRVEYVAAVRPSDPGLRSAIDGALESLRREGRLRALYERWGLWNPEAAAVLGDDASAASRPAAAPEALEAWRAAAGRLPSMAERLRLRYPRLLGLLLRGAGMSLVLSVASMLLAVGVGMALAVGRTRGPAPVRWAATGYVELVRGTPLLIQLIVVYFGLPELGLSLHPFVAGWLALGMNYAAAEAENYRAGMESVATGQLEAARALGLSGAQTLRYIVGPQALRTALPPMTNDFISLLKDSSLVSLVTLTELTKTYENLAAATRDHLGLGVLVAALYLAMGLPFAYVSRRLETRLGRHLRRA